MNRKTKGALAMGAGAIILLGGAGSFALWSDTEGVAGGDIQTGAFGLNCDSGTWTDISSDAATTTIAAGDLMVPGDTWSYAGTCTVTATGKNMNATLGVDLGSSSVPSDNFVVTTTVNGADSTTTPQPVTNGQSYGVTVKVEFLASTPDVEDTESTVSVSDMAVTLNQVRP